MGYRKSRPPVFGLAIVAIVFMLQAQSSLAAYSNYNSILIGDQAAGMGGAYTAMAEDAAAQPWYNPATLAFLKGESFSAAVGIYKKFDTTYGSSEDFTKASLRVNQGFFRALPSSTGSVVRFKEFLPDYTLALSIIVPEYESFKGDIHNTSDNISTLTLSDESLWVGASLSKKISVNEGMGLSLYYTARSMVKTVSDRTISGSTMIAYSEERAITQNALVAILGYYYKWTPNFRLGASVRFPSMHVAGFASYFDSYINASGTPTQKNYSSLDSKTRIPAKYTLGWSWQALDELVIAGDVSVYGREQYNDLESEDVAEKIEHRQIWNGSLGAELALRTWLKIRVGGYTNFSAHPDPDLTKVKGQGDHVDQLGFSANAALIRGNMQYTFGGYYTGGRGKSVQRFNQQYQLVDKATQVFTMLIGTSYSF
jgi:long-chain fatty acid transport protein